MIRARVYHILDKLGVDRVERAHESFSDRNPCGVGGCFLARAYGPKYAFVRAWFLQESHEGWVSVLAKALGLTYAETMLMVRLFDTKRKLLERIVDRWLQLQEVSV